MDAVFDHLAIRAATIDERLSPDFEPVEGDDADRAAAAARLAAWRRASAGGDEALFARRLARDGLDLDAALARLGAGRRAAGAPPPAWLADAIWIDAALRRESDDNAARFAPSAQPFADLFAPLAARAEATLWAGVGADGAACWSPPARDDLRAILLARLCDIAAPALYERFDAMRRAGATHPYAVFRADMRGGGFRRLFEDKPVLLRLLAIIARQWIETSREVAARLAADLPDLRGALLPETARRVAGVEGGLSDLHNRGRGVLILTFEDGSRCVYKPKELALDAAFDALVRRLNGAAPPVDLRAARIVAREGYGWSEHIAHAPCADAAGVTRYFRRAGALLALLHTLAATDMHQENLIAAGDQPVPVDLETLLQTGAAPPERLPPESQADAAALALIADSVAMVGLLPTCIRGADDQPHLVGGLTADWNIREALRWSDVGADAMRPARARETGPTTNLPHLDGRPASFADHLAPFVAGFRDYALFLSQHAGAATRDDLLAGFARASARKIVRHTRFYQMLTQRLKDPVRMDDGAIWSAQADFVARLADWTVARDPLWPLLRSEREALLALNVPCFVARGAPPRIADADGLSAPLDSEAGIDRVEARWARLDAREIDWQTIVIAPTQRDPHARPAPPPPDLRACADAVADELERYAIRRGAGAAWIGLDALGGSTAFQLVRLGGDLYNGVGGIAVFFAAHAAVARRDSSAGMARAAVAHLRRELTGPHAARLARAMGLGAASGLGSVVYALAAMAKLLDDGDLLADAHRVAALFADELIAADRRLNVMSGAAGAILALLRLHRDGGAPDVLARAAACGDHLLRQPRIGAPGRLSWRGRDSGPQDVNGFSHGAAGFAYALAALAQATGRADFAQAARDCVAFENASYDPARRNWPDLHDEAAPDGEAPDGETRWPMRWCHGATGVGLARLGMKKRGGAGLAGLTADIDNALAGVRLGWPRDRHTLCCGELGAVEFYCEAAEALGRPDLRAVATRALTALVAEAAAQGDYRWDSGGRRFNPGLFRGLAGVGYTALRRLDPALPNVLLWE